MLYNTNNSVFLTYCYTMHQFYDEDNKIYNGNLNLHKQVRQKLRKEERNNAFHTGKNSSKSCH